MVHIRPCLLLARLELLALAEQAQPEDLALSEVVEVVVVERAPSLMPEDLLVIVMVLSMVRMPLVLSQLLVEPAVREELEELEEMV